MDDRYLPVCMFCRDLVADKQHDPADCRAGYLFRAMTVRLSRELSGEPLLPDSRARLRFARL